MQHIEKWIPLVKKLAINRSGVNMIYEAQDLEQEALVTLLRFWNRLAELDDLSTEKMIKTIFKNRVIDIVRNQMRRPDTYWNCKSDLLDAVSETSWAGQTAKDSAEWVLDTEEPVEQSTSESTVQVEFDMAGERFRAEMIEERETTIVVQVVGTDGELRNLVRNKTKHNCIIIRVYPAGAKMAKARKAPRPIKTSRFRKEVGAFQSEVPVPGQNIDLEETLQEFMGWAEDEAGYGGPNEATDLAVFRKILEDDPDATLQLKEDLKVSVFRWNKVLDRARAALGSVG